MDVAEYATRTPAVFACGEDTGKWASGELSSDVTVSDDPDGVLDGASGEFDCVVLGTDLDDPVDHIRRICDAEVPPPVLFAPRDADPAMIAAASAAGATGVYPIGAETADSLESVVETLVHRYDTARQRRREQQMFRAILGSFPQSIYVKDGDARIVACSDAVETAADGSPIGKTDLEVFGDDLNPDNARETYEDDLQVIETADPIVGRLERHQRNDDDVLWLETSKFPWMDGDDVAGLVGETRDVTAAKRREQELEHEKQRLEQFASFASHDLRNPLAVADGHVQHAIETGDQDTLHAASDALDRMERLVDDLLNIVKPGSRPADEQWTDLPAVTKRAWSAVESGDATLRVDLPDDLQIHAASGALRQLLENVLSNAVEHGGPSVTVTVGTTPTGFYVADDGPGIPESDRAHVFDHGFTTGGTGVGLAVAAEIADAHAWEPGVCESEDGGARFEFNRCLVCRADEPRPVEGAAVPFETTTTIGDTSFEGTARSAVAGEWTLEGAGRALWGDIEEYTAVHAATEGDCRIVAKLRDLTQVHEYSKAGVIVAGAIEPGAPFGFVGATAAHGHEAAWRPSPGDPVDTRQIDEGDVIPGWYRIDRIGQRLTCYTSVDGEEWRPVDQHVLPLEGRVAAGLAVNSHERGTPSEAVFSDVELVTLEAGDQ